MSQEEIIAEKKKAIFESTLELVRENGFHGTPMSLVAKKAGVAARFYRVGSMFCSYFCDQPIKNLTDAMKSDRAKFGRFFHGMLNQGIYFAPSQFEAGFISTAHGEADVETTIAAAHGAFARLE